jgi:methionyl-tRNA formyltransferase
MKLAFMGAPDFAIPALRALVAAGHDIAAVYAQPPKPAGRGQRETPCPVHRVAQGLGLNVRTPQRLKGNAAELAWFQALGVQACVVAAYGLILPPAFLAAPARGCLNIHASLLPRWRGAAPIQSAILAGDTQTGITIMQMAAGLDTGPMLLRRATPIGARDTAADLHDRLAAMGAAMIVEVLANPPPPVPQDDALATYAAKLSREDARLDFTRPAVELERQIRAYTPWPGALGLLGDVVIKFLAAEVVPGEGLPGTLLPPNPLRPDMVIACGQDALRPLRLQRAGRAPMAAKEFLRGFTVPPDARFF